MEQHPDCGLFPTSQMTNAFYTESFSLANQTTATRKVMSPRIINGKEAEFAIPWVARLEINTKGTFHLCTGFVITALHIMTAAHCVCDAEGICVVDFSPSVFATKQKAYAYVGGPKKDKLERHRAKRATAHPEFQGHGVNDIAILELYRSIKFTPLVKPICLANEGTDDQNVLGFTAGWGLRYRKEEAKDAIDPDNPRSTCTSNEVGPSTFKQCIGDYVNCNRIDLPPYNSSGCFTWVKKAIESSPSTLADQVKLAQIIRLQLDLNLTCYTPNPYGEYGWCYTSGDEESWGFCSRSCFLANTSLAALEYVTLSTIPSSQCSGITSQLELCVGGTAPRATVANFRAQLSGINREEYTFHFESIGPDPVNILFYDSKGDRKIAIALEDSKRGRRHLISKIRDNFEKLECQGNTAAMPS